jgi:hypothetical protein
LKGALVHDNCLASGYAHSFVLVDAEDEESLKVLEACPIFQQDELPAVSQAAAADSSAASAGAAAGGKKREAAENKAADTKKAKKKN